MSDIARRQRAGLCDLLASLTAAQWECETLCEGWDAADVAAHLIIREREPWTAPGLFLGGPFATLTAQRRAAWRARGRARLIEALRAGPPWPLSGPLAESQVVEDWIHEQDIRRGGAQQPGAAPDDRLAAILWPAATRFALRTLALGVDAVVGLTDGRRQHGLRIRRRWPVAVPTDDEADAIVSGDDAGELLLYVAGRREARVTFDGDPGLVERLSSGARAL